MMCVVAIVGSGPSNYLPDLTGYETEVDIWIGADRGALEILDRGIMITYAVGDFDSVTQEQKEVIFANARHTDEYSHIKDKTDLEIALQTAFDLNAKKIYLFGITGGRLDHELINVQLLYTIIAKGIKAIIINRWNQLELKEPGTHKVFKDKLYPFISFVPFTERVRGISLSGFAYPLTNYDVTWGSTRLISNWLQLEMGSVSFKEGLLLFVQSRDNDEVK